MNSKKIDINLKRCGSKSQGPHTSTVLRAK